MSKMSNDKSAVPNPPGFIPLQGQGLRAKESQVGATGTKEWLKSIKLHKYWPLVSHWSYWQMLALTEDNIEYNIKAVGGTGITCGAQGRLLRSIEELRERKPKLMKLIRELGSNRGSMEEELSYLQKVVYTPFPTSEEDFLPTLVVHSILKIKEHITLNKNSTQDDIASINQILRAVKQNPVLNRAEENLKSLPYLWDIHLTLTNYAVRSSRVLSRILLERTRNTSADSGFEENIDVSDNSTTWPLEIDTIMLELPTGDEYQKLFLD